MNSTPYLYVLSDFEILIFSVVENSEVAEKPIEIMNALMIFHRICCQFRFFSNCSKKVSKSRQIHRIDLSKKSILFNKA